MSSPSAVENVRLYTHMGAKLRRQAASCMSGVSAEDRKWLIDRAEEYDRMARLEIVKLTPDQVKLLQQE